MIERLDHRVPRRRCDTRLFIKRAAVVVVLASLAFAGVALASPLFSSTFELTYLPTKPGSSGGIETFMTWSDPGETGGKPKRLTRIQFHFNPGTKIDTRALKQCKASDTDVRIEGARACPKASRLGFATSRVTTGVTPPDQTQITFFNAPRQIIVMVRVEGRTLAVYRDDIKGRVVTVNLGLPSGLSLLELRATIKPHAKGRGKKRRIYFRTPSVCPPSGEWTTTVIFTYVDGSSQQLADGSPCRKTSAAAHTAFTSS
jgi:hypothetical protein